MTESRQRGVGAYTFTDTQLNSHLSWMDLEALERNARNLWADLDAARWDFVSEMPWHPNNRYHLADWWEQLGKWYEMRRRAEMKRAAAALAKVGAA